jgi:hypothetical protein
LRGADIGGKAIDGKRTRHRRIVLGGQLQTGGSDGMVQPKDINSGRSNFQLDDCPGRDSPNFDYLLIRPLTRHLTEAAIDQVF